jgi:hypothetical protein
MVDPSVCLSLGLSFSLDTKFDDQCNNITYCPKHSR